MLSLLGKLVLVALISLLTNLYRGSTYWKRRGVPQETPYPIVGNYKGVGSQIHFRDINQRLYNQFKGTAPFGGSYMFLNKSALILDLDLVNNILIKDFSTFHDRGIFNNVRDDPLVGNLVTLEGAQWSAMRSKLITVFTAAKMKYMFPTVVRVGEILGEVMEHMVKQSSDSIMEVHDICARYTTDVIGTCAFGIECNSLKDPNAEFRLKGRSIFTTRRHHPLVEQFILTNPGVARKLRMKFFTEDVTNFFMNAIKTTVDYRTKNNVKRNDFMDLLIELMAKDEEMAKDSQAIDLSLGLTIEQMTAQTFVFFTAGFETSSTTMSFCLYELARRQDIQDKLRLEIWENLKANEGVLTYEGLNDMQYLDQVVAETLRCYPVLPQLIRKTKNDYQVPNSTHIIEKGTTIIIPVDAIHHDPEYYNEPNTFNPDRFVPSECEKRHPCAYLPFGEGPRHCIGLRFGKTQTKIGLISFLRGYRFECCPQTEVVINNRSFLLTARDGIRLKVVPLHM